MNRVRGLIEHRVIRIPLMVASLLLIGYAILSMLGLLEAGYRSDVMDFCSAFLLYTVIVFLADDYLFDPLHDRWQRLRDWLSIESPQSQPVQAQTIQHTSHYQHNQYEAIRYLYDADTIIERQAVLDYMIEEDLLVKAKLRLMNLDHAYLIKANLAYANLDSTDLQDANLAGANLAKVNLCRANLANANLTLANLFETGLNGAILPDGTEWTFGTDMRRFTDPDHADYWMATQ